MDRLETLINFIIEQMPLQRKQLKKIIDVLNNEECIFAERTLSFFMERMSYTIIDIADAYKWFIDTFMQAQMEFFRSNKYQHSTFAEIEDYYKDTQIMKNYVISLATTQYLFLQHIEANRFYKNALKNLHKDKQAGTRYLEIGPGHGCLFVTAMENSNFENYTAVDISQSSVYTTTAFVEYCLPNKKNWSVQHKDFFKFNSKEKFDAIVMGEVLEHVEQPRKFLEKIYELAKDDAFIYITTAVNSPCFDHIYYFGTVNEVEQLFEECGFFVKDKVYGIANGVDFKKAVKKKYTIVPAYVLKKL